MCHSATVAAVLYCTQQVTSQSDSDSDSDRKKGKKAGRKNKRNDGQKRISGGEKSKEIIKARNGVAHSADLLRDTIDWLALAILHFSRHSLEAQASSVPRRIPEW